MTIRVARIQDRFVRIVRTAQTVAFSQQKNWVLIEHDIDLPEHRHPIR